jgi:hypothetical protein
MEPLGLELHSKTADKSDILMEAVQNPVHSDADLRRVVEAWPMLSKRIRAVVVALVTGRDTGPVIAD